MDHGDAHARSAAPSDWALTSARRYRENFEMNLPNAVNICVPAAVTVFPGEFRRAPRTWPERYEPHPSAGCDVTEPSQTPRETHKGVRNRANTTRRPEGPPPADPSMNWVLPTKMSWASGKRGETRSEAKSEIPH